MYVFGVLRRASLRTDPVFDSLLVTEMGADFGNQNGNRF